MVHDTADVLTGPAILDSVRVAFDEQRLISDAGLLVTATLAERWALRSWSTSRCGLTAGPGCVAAGPEGAVAGARDARRRGPHRSDERAPGRIDALVLGHRVMAPSTLGTFLRAFTFGHVRQLDRVLDVTLTRAWSAGGGPGDGPLVIDIDSFIGEVHSDRSRAPATGTPASSGITRSSRSAPIPARCCTSATARGRPTRSVAARRFVDELLARVRRAGQPGPVMIRADSGFENHKLMRDLAPVRWSSRSASSRASRSGR